jgi:hypothetical protein
MKWKNCSLRTVLRHHSPVFDLVRNSLTTGLLFGVQAFDETFAAPNLHWTFTDKALRPCDRFAVVSANDRFASYEMPVVPDDVRAIISHLNSHYRM